MVHLENATSTAKVSIWRQVFAIDLRTLAVFRMGIAAVLLGDMVERLWHVGLYYTDQGLLPAAGIDQVYGSSIAWTSLHYHTGGSVWLQAVIVGIGVVAAGLLAVGFQTRLMTFLSWILFVSLNRRVSSMCSGGDDLMRLMLFWSLFLPLGARWSLDALRQKRDGEALPSEGQSYFSAATVAILLQLCYVYFFTSIFKALSPTWYNGTAVQEALQYEVHVRPLGLWLSDKTLFLRLLTYATLIAEFGVPFLVLSPVKNAAARWLGVLMMLSFHLGILLCMRIGTFPWVCMACWLIFIPGQTWDWFTRGKNVDDSTLPPMSLRKSWWESSDLATTIVITLLLFVTVYNVLTLQPSKKWLNPIKKIAKYSRLDQEWKMYVRFPDDGWFVMPCLLEDGTTFDIYRNQSVTYDKPAVISAEFPTARVKKLFLDHRVFGDGSARSPLWPWVVMHYVQQWNQQHSDRRVQKAQFAYMFEDVHEGPVRPYTYLEFDLASGNFFLLPQANLLDYPQEENASN